MDQKVNLHVVFFKINIHLNFRWFFMLISAEIMLKVQKKSVQNADYKYFSGCRYSDELLEQWFSG